MLCAPRLPWLLSFTTVFVLVSHHVGEAREWSLDATAGRMLMQTCTQNSECATLPVCGYCDTQQGTCINNMVTGAQCQVGDEYGSCANGDCEVCTSDNDCADRTDSKWDCTTCQRGGGVQVCKPVPDGQSCLLWEVGPGNCQAGTCGIMSNVVNDPIIGGFDGHKFHFNEVGDFTLLQEGRGWKVDATFSAAPAIEEGGAELKESSWTTAVRVFNAQGDGIACSIPAVYPNTSTVQVISTPAGAYPVSLTPQMTKATLDQMDVAAILSWKEYAGVQYSSVVGCKVSTPFMDINVYQVSGWEEAQAKPEEHGWAAPFTWLNVDFHLRQRLAAPVTGIMGATYPKEGVQEDTQDVLRPSTAPAGGDASVEGEAGDAARQLMDSSSFQLSFSVVGL